MSVLPLSALVAAACLLAGCGGGSGDRVLRSAKAWDTPFVVVRPIPAEVPHDANGKRRVGRYNPNLAAYGQMPVSLDATYVAEAQALADEAAASAASAAAPDEAAASAVVPAVVPEVITATVLPVPRAIVLADPVRDDSLVADKVADAVSNLSTAHDLRAPVDIERRATVVEVQPAPALRLAAND